mmetsp:Transcript_35391/g.85650  ORF Transcript_35391/g.85650 Transcript_35391/m.85650 type:complete len:272 (-) Transcript_35391:1672-2487(-)
MSSSSSSSSSTITILGLGSLLSERSSRTTFPNLQNFRLGRVQGYRRVFGHPASIFFQRGLANIETKEYSSLSAEPVTDSDDGGDSSSSSAVGFVCSVFEVPRDEIMTVATNDGDSGGSGGENSENSEIPSQAFLEREEEFNIIQVPYTELDAKFAGSEDNSSQNNLGVLCTRSTDEAYVERWGLQRFNKHYKQYGIDTIWNFSTDSQLKPCQVYLRHCYLAAEKLGPACFNSFLDETFLVDRSTTVRQYVSENPHVLETLPPPGFEERYSG